ncbi:preprotein translocase subunit SecY, partial [Staphylococcus gallinarum]
IQIYANNNLNGLSSLGILLAIISFIYDMLLKNKENK